MINNSSASHSVLGADHGRVIQPRQCVGPSVRTQGLEKIRAAPPSAMEGVKERDTQMLFEVLNLDTRRTRKR